MPKRSMTMTMGSNGDPPSTAEIEESYLELADNVLSLHARSRLGSLAVTSTESGEGVSTIASNLAVALAQNGAGEVLLIDANLRSPALARHFGLEGKPGLSEAILGEADPSEFIARTGVHGLSLMTSGTTRGHPSHIYASEGLEDLIRALDHRYSIVIFDAPAMRAHRDTEILAPLVDGVLLVIEAERVIYEIIERARDRIVAAGGKIIGAALNRRRYPIPHAIYRRL